KIPGRLNHDYIYPTSSELAQLASFGVNTVRLPIRWERIRPEMDGALSSSELGQITASYESAKAHGICLIIDLHNYARYYGESLADNAQLKTAFATTWLALAAA